MTWVAVAIGGSAVVSGVVGANAANKAAQSQRDAAQMSIDQQNRMFDIQNEQQRPYREAGYTALKDIQTQLPELNRRFTSADLNANLAPNYDFMLKQGQGANMAASNATGGMVGGNALRGLESFTQDYAGTAYQNAFANYQNQNANIYNRLSNLAGIGQASQGQISNLAANTTNAISGLNVGAANATASGLVGQANAISGGISGLGNAAMYYGMMNPSNAGGTSGYGYGAFNSIPSSAIAGNSNFIGPPA